MGGTYIGPDSERALSTINQRRVQFVRPIPHDELDTFFAALSQNTLAEVVYKEHVTRRCVPGPDNGEVHMRYIRVDGRIETSAGQTLFELLRHDNTAYTGIEFHCDKSAGVALTEAQELGLGSFKSAIEQYFSRSNL